MKKKLKAICFVALMVAGCNQPSQFEYNYTLGEFGAFYTRIQSGKEFEKHARVSEHADIIVDLGWDGATFNFWRGSSYLPYLQVNNNRYYVDEIVPRDGDGTEKMPDRVNMYSHVKIIESNPDQVVVHWRYLPQFEGGNPRKGADKDKFVDEYFYIKPDGQVTRTIRKGTERVDAWRDPENKIVQTFTLTKNGIENSTLQEAKRSQRDDPVSGNPIIAKTVVEPVAWWSFNESKGNYTAETVSNTSVEVDGHKTLWRKGVSGTALQFDGYYSNIELPADNAPKPKDAMTIESWVALGAYPWSDVPIVQQIYDEPEQLIAKRGGEAHLIGEERRDEFEEGLDEGTEQEEFGFVLKEENDTGYFFGIDGYGNPVYKLRAGDSWHQLITDYHLERRQWYHLAATYSKTDGMMRVFVNGDQVAEKRVDKADIVLSEKPVKIGQGKPRRPIRPVRDNTFKDIYSLDGLMDEIKIYDVALSSDQIKQSYEIYAPNMELISSVNMEKRVLPDGENRNEFSAYYKHLRFYDVWDNQWRFSDHPDVIVEFEKTPSKFVFWRGTGYIPMMVNEKGQWYSNEFNETWNKSGGQGCMEPMSDKEAFTNHARIIENTPARKVIHWRYPLLDVNHVMANYDEETGWCDWSDWYYYIYPDGVAVKTMRLWTHGERNHEWQESMAIFGPDQHPEQIIHTENALSMLNLEGEKVDYDWVNGPPDRVEKPEGQCIQYINYTGEYKPLTMGDFLESDVYGGELTPYAVFPTWNHWPVAQMPSDGRYALFSDRTAHSSLTHVPPVTYREEKSGPTPFQEKILLEAMVNDKPEDMVPLARSWMNAPEMENLKGAEGRYEPGERAYLLNKKEENVSFTIAANKQSPIVNMAIIIKNWGNNDEAEVIINDKSIPNLQGIFRDTDGSKTMAIWIDIFEFSEMKIDIR
jgi:hypothetical protein